MSNMQSLAIGIVSGILTSALIYLFISIFKSIVLPWYRQLVYRGIEIQGQWTSSTDLGDGLTEEWHVELSQKADCVSGSINQIKLEDGKILRSESLRLSGNLKDRFLCASAFPTQKSRLSASSVLLEIVGDGSEMRGCQSWYDIGRKTIISGTISFERVGKIKL